MPGQRNEHSKRAAKKACHEGVAISQYMSIHATRCDARQFLGGLQAMQESFSNFGREMPRLWLAMVSTSSLCQLPSQNLGNFHAAAIMSKRCINIHTLHTCIPASCICTSTTRLSRVRKLPPLPYRSTHGLYRPQQRGHRNGLNWPCSQQDCLGAMNTSFSISFSICSKQDATPFSIHDWPTHGLPHEEAHGTMAARNIPRPAAARRHAFYLNNMYRAHIPVGLQSKLTMNLSG